MKDKNRLEELETELEREQTTSGNIESLDFSSPEEVQKASFKIEAQKMKTAVICTKEVISAIRNLTQTIDKHERTATRLGRTLNWLTGVIAVATIAGVIITVWLALRGG